MTGFIAALLLIITICLIEQRLDGQGIKRLSVKASNRILKRHAELITPETEEDRLQQELIEKNAASGQGTPLDDL